MFSKKATKIVEIFTVNLMLCSKYEIDSEDFVKLCGLLRKHKLYAVFTNADPTATVFGLHTCNWGFLR